MVVSDPTNGFGGGAGLLTLYRLNETAPRDSQTAVFGYYTTTSSWKAGFQQIVSFGEDRFRSTTTGIFGNVNNSFAYPNLPADVVYGERQNSLFTNFTYNLYERLYVGLNFRFARTEFVLGDGTEQERKVSEAVLTEDGARTTTDSGLGLVLEWDSRDNEYTPSNGIFASLQLLAFRDWLGSDNDYRTVETFVNAYREIRPEQVLAVRFRWRQASGSVPFSGQSMFSGVDLRAYPTGKYRGDGMLAGQAEYRFHAWKRLGGVVFAGTGRVYGGEPTLGANEVLPSAGGGIRFLLLKDRDTRVGLDFAKGKDGNSGVYFFFGEAF